MYISCRGKNYLSVIMRIFVSSCITGISIYCVLICAYFSLKYLTLVAKRGWRVTVIIDVLGSIVMSETVFPSRYIRGTEKQNVQTHTHTHKNRRKFFIMKEQEKHKPEARR